MEIASFLTTMKDWILPGTKIISDCLADKGYTHLKVNHSLDFVDTIAGACTNKIEASWNAAKRTMVI